MLQTRNVYILLFSLYWAQGLPVGFMTHALPVILRAQGVSLAQIGGFGLLMLPWSIKVFWAPVLDRFVGSIYASGKTPFQLQQIALTLKESDIRDLTLNSQGFVQGQKLQDYVNKHVGNKPIQQFPIRFAAVATRLDTGRKADFIKGNAGQAVRASCSIPNVFVPAVIGGTKYVDGGLVSPIPVKTAKDMGADIVIAIDISARPVGNKPLNMWGLLDQTINIMGQQSINEELSQATVVIQPKVGHLGTLDLKASNQSILEGEKAAQLKIKSIEKAIVDFKKTPAAFKPAPKAKF
jgi:NTE family protein